jgi:hypothetical protein
VQHSKESEAEKGGVTNLPPYRCLELKIENGHVRSPLDEFLQRPDRPPFLIWIGNVMGGGEAYWEYESLDEAKAAADAFNGTDDWVAAVYGADGRRI